MRIILYYVAKKFFVRFYISMIISKIRTNLNKLTPGMTFNKYVKNVLYRGQDCGYIEEAGKRKYALTPALEKLETKLSMNDFDVNKPRFIDQTEFQTLKHLLKPFIKNEKGLKKLDLNHDLYYSPSPASIVIWDKKTNTPVVQIIKKLKYPTKEIFYHAFPFLRKILRHSPYVY